MDAPNFVQVCTAGVCWFWVLWAAVMGAAVACRSVTRLYQRLARYDVAERVG